MAKSNSGAGFLTYMGIAFIGYLILGRVGGAAYSNVSFGRPRIRFGRLSPTGVDVTLTIPVTNQNPVSLPLDGLVGQVMYGNYTMLPFQLSNPVTIAAGNTTEVTFSSQLRFAEVGGNIAELLTSGSLLQDLRIEGRAFIKGATIPFSNTIGIG